MSDNKEQNKQKNKKQEKQKDKAFNFDSMKKPKPFENFSNAPNFKGGPPKSFNTFHRRLGK